MNSTSFALISIMSLLIGCSNNRTTPVMALITATENTDNTLLFNGKTLDGWEVTNFGSQGPLSVDKSPGSLIVGGWGGGIVGISNIKAIRNSFLENNCSNSQY